jgi:hypothetical protein
MEYADDYSSYGNKVLYRMCTERPRHDDIDTIESKLCLIGRTYSAAIERKAGKEFLISNAAERIRSSRLDDQISELQRIDRIDIENARVLLHAHKYFTNILKDATGVDKRSLASKYLHFHAPRSVFIYDSKANKKIREIVNASKKRFELKKSFDDAYEGFVYRCLHYRNEILEAQIGARATPRRIDNELLGHSSMSRIRAAASTGGTPR